MALSTAGRPLALLLALAGCDARGRSISIAAVTDRANPDYGTVRIEGLPKSARDQLVRGVAAPVRISVTPHTDSLPGTTPLAGVWTTSGPILHFRPRFPPAGDMELWVAVDSGRLEITRHFALPRRATTGTTTLVAIRPTADTVPENLLRMYLEFSGPMQPGQALHWIHLVDDRNGEVERAFLDTAQELWDPTGSRLTLLFDPGRVKRGIRTNLESGRPLLAGHRYRLEVRAGWLDQQGEPLAVGGHRILIVGPATSDGPDPNRWSLRQPTAGSYQPLVVDFGKPLDHALASRLLRVENEQGREIHGTVSLEPGDRVWRFTPASEWDEARYQLVVSPELEDLAGNRPGRPFDVDLAHDRPAEEASTKPLIRWFTPGGGGPRY